MDPILGKEEEMNLPILGNDEPGILDNIVGFLQQPQMQAMAQAALPVAMGQGGYGDNAYSAALRGMNNYQVKQPELNRQARKDRIAELTAMADLNSKQAYIDNLQFNRELAEKKYALENAKFDRQAKQDNLIQKAIFGGGNIQENNIPFAPPQAPYANETMQMTMLPGDEPQPNSSQVSPITQPNPDALMKFGALTGNKEVMQYGEYLDEKNISRLGKNKSDNRLSDLLDNMDSKLKELGNDSGPIQSYNGIEVFGQKVLPGYQDIARISGSDAQAKRDEINSLRTLLSAEIKNLIRKPGEGTWTDKDQEVLERALPNIIYDYDTNRKIIENTRRTYGLGNRNDPNSPISGIEFLGFEEAK